MSKPTITVVDNPAAAAAGLIARVAVAGGHIALSGGSTPKAAYAQAAAELEDWSAATLWFGDDRAVPPEDERSNYLLAKASLLDQIRGGQPTVHRIRGEEGYEAAAGNYNEALRGEFGSGMPSLDLVLLGIGSDGHTASLFPGKPALDVEDEAVVGVPEAGLEPFVPRVTFTFPAINASKHVVFLIEGEGKAEAVGRAFGPDPDLAGGGRVPAGRVSPAGDFTVLLDAAAAARLEGAA